MACDNCKDAPGFYCPICAPTPPSKPAVCDVCHDPTCPCGKVVLRTDAELIDALRDCRWILGQQVAAKDAEIARLRACIAEVEELTAAGLDYADGNKIDVFDCTEAEEAVTAMRDIVAIIAKHEVGNV